jgi:hypothetical protein
MNERPIGVTIMAWLAIVFGAFGIIGSVAAFFAALAFMAIGAGAAGLGAVGGGASVAFSAFLLLGSAVFLLALAVVEVIFGVGALQLKGWAWTLGMYWCYASVALNIVNIFASYRNIFGALIGAIIGVAIAVLILYYLFRPEVKGAFGKSAMAPPDFLVGVFSSIDGIVNSSNAAAQQQRNINQQQQQGPGGYQPPQPPQPPQAPGGYPPPPPQAH